jgi:hypothetical protein
MLAAMGAQISELAADTSSGAAFMQTGSTAIQNAEFSMRRAGLGYGSDA